MPLGDCGKSCEEQNGVLNMQICGTEPKYTYYLWFYWQIIEALNFLWHFDYCKISYISKINAMRVWNCSKLCELLNNVQNIGLKPHMDHINVNLLSKSELIFLNYGMNSYSQMENSAITVAWDCMASDGISSEGASAPLQSLWQILLLQALLSPSANSAITRDPTCSVWLGNRRSALRPNLPQCLHLF